MVQICEEQEQYREAMAREEQHLMFLENEDFEDDVEHQRHVDCFRSRPDRPREPLPYLLFFEDYDDRVLPNDIETSCTRADEEIGAALLFPYVTVQQAWTAHQLRRCMPASAEEAREMERRIASGEISIPPGTVLYALASLQATPPGVDPTLTLLQVRQLLHLGFQAPTCSRTAAAGLAVLRERGLVSAPPS